MTRIALGWLIVVALVLVPAGPALQSIHLAGPGVAQAVSGTIVISQVYGGGGNTGATYTHDFIELFNRGTAPVSLGGLSLQYASATGTGNFGGNSGQLTELSGTIQPGRYFLVQQATSGPTGAALPSPDLVDPTPINMSATGGKVALATGTTSLGCNGGSLPCGPDQLARIIDLVGYGNANFFEGSAAPAPSNITAVLRAGSGCVETDNNAADFAAAAPLPRNTATAPNFCGAVDAAPTVASTSPFNTEQGVAPNATVTITFSEDVAATGSWFSINCTATGPHAATFSGAPRIFILLPTTPFTPGETCTVTASAAQITDLDAIDPPDNMAANHTFSFTVAALVQIADIQGASHISPLNGQRRTTEGIVTVKAPSSFWIQDPSPDANDATSEGLLVFGSAAAALVQLGDAVQVRGTVTEFRPGGAAQPNLTTTELTSPSVTVLSSGNPVPAPTVIGLGGRVPPTTVIDDDATGSVETGGTFDPATDGIDFYESLEGMRVRVNNAVAVGPRNNFGEIAILADGGAGTGVRTARGGIVIRATDFNPERIILDDVLMATPVVKVRDTFTGPVVGVMDYSFGNFKLLITAPLTPVDGGLAREVTRAAADHEIVVGTYNVENLSPNSGPAQFERHASLIVNNLRSPDLLAIEEIQDNDGVQNGTSSIVTDASVTWTMLIDAIRAAGGPTYQYRQIDPVDDQDGGVPGGNIRVGFLFRTDRGLEFIDRPGGTPTTPTLVVQTPSGPQLSVSPGRIAPDDPAWSTPEGVRKPLAGEFRMRGRKVFVIANHLKSKSGDQPLFGRFQPPTLVTEAQRSAETEVLKDFVEELLDADPNASIVLLGDLNDFEFSRPLTILKEAGLHALIESLPQSERYSYVFDGNSQTLDQVLISGNLFSNFAFTYDVVHVNSEFPDQASDHEPSVVRLDLRGRPVPKQP